MDQLIAKLSIRSGIQKQDVSLIYQTNSDESNAACILDSDYQRPDHDVTEEQSRSRPKVNEVFCYGTS